MAGIFGLFPLIFTPGGKDHRMERRYWLTLNGVASESIIKVLYSVLWLILVYVPLHRQVYE